MPWNCRDCERVNYNLVDDCAFCHTPRRVVAQPATACGKEEWQDAHDREPPRKCFLPSGHAGPHAFIVRGGTARVTPAALPPAAPEFVKSDSGKLPHDLLPFVALEQVSAVLAFGAKKYAAHGWRKIDKRSRYFSATLRHLFAYAKGEDKDPESGLPHLAHAACSVLFLLEASVSGLGEDDRPRDGTKAP